MPYKDPEEARQHRQRYYQDNKERIDERNREWLKRNPGKQRIYADKWIDKNREHVNLTAKHWRNTNREKDRFNRNSLKAKHKTAWLQIIKELGMHVCSACGYSKSFVAIDFHHPNPADKEKRNPNQMLYEKPTTARIEKLKKCIALCANCHRELHHKDKQFYVI